jgi:hypothetical protein
MRLVACLLAAACVTAADPAEALRLPASGPELAAAAQGWDAEALLGLLADADPARRRGAARLAAALPVPADRLLTALLASPDREVRRLGASGLRGAAVALADLARFPDADVLAALVSEHPNEDPLAEASLTTVVEGWLADPARAQQAARLITSRGSAARWSGPLLKALEHANPAVVAAAHDALQALTRSQRSLDAYAGDRRLLAQDWRDLLAARPSVGRPDAELMALVAELPAAEALAALLARGPVALAAIESAQAGASHARQRELEPAARLLAHGVPPQLYAALGAAAFADLDHADPAKRTACLRHLVGEIRSRADAAGLGLLICALDDGDSTVRATALDQLVRLSDEAKRFRRPWRIGTESLFQSEHTVRRLRRSLRDGAPDEQIAALLLCGSLEAKDLADDVLPLVLSPRDDVVGTALETLKGLEPGGKQIAVLARLCADQTLPAARRIAAAGVLGKILQGGSYDSSKPNPGAAALAPLIRLVNDPEPRIATAAVKALAEGRAKGPVLRNALDRLVQRGLLDAALGIADERDEPEVIALLVDRVLAASTDADRAALALAEGLSGWSDSRRKGITTATAKPGLRSLVTVAGQPGQTALARALGLITTEVALPRLVGEAEIRDRALAVLASRVSTIGELGAVAEAARDAPAGNSRARRAIQTRALALAARAPDRIAVVVAEAHSLLDIANTDSSSRDGANTRTLTLRDGSILHLEAPLQADRKSWDNDDLPWRLVGTPPGGGPDAAGLLALATLVAALPVSDDERADRDLAVAWLSGREPAPALAARWQHDEGLCRLCAAAWPAFHEALVGCIVADMKPGEASLWRLRSWLRLDPARLAPPAVQLLLAEESLSDYEAKPVLRAIAGLPPERIAELLPSILSKPALAKLAGELITKSGPLALPAALALAEGPGLGEQQTLLPLAAEAGEPIAARLAAWTSAEILARAASARRLRSAGSAPFDAALGRLIAQSDPAAAAWLRSGIPAEAGLLDAYRQAEGSTVPELALVGSAFALKEGRLDPAAFLARVAAWPSPVQADAAAAARRYCEGKWEGLAGPTADLVRRLGARALGAWIAVLPANPTVVAALAERAADPATADALGGALAQRQARDAAWKAAVPAIAAGAQGRLDWLKASTP